ncbi:MAG: hypothetical protein MK108_09995 [Mariniblastus sp.]|nr:hypothetical protein [Mariniblastus sp.]
MRFHRTSLFLISFLAWGSMAFGQDNQYFNGNGINMKRAEPGRTMMFDFSKLVNEPEQQSEPLFKLPKLSLPKWQAPHWDWSGMLPAKPAEAKNPLTAPKPMVSGFEIPKWNMFPDRNPEQPSFLQKMNDRNREFWGRTRQNFSVWTGDLENLPGSGGFDTWNRITRGFHSDSEATQPPAQPPLRSARQQGGEKTIRY